MLALSSDMLADSRLSSVTACSEEVVPAPSADVLLSCSAALNSAALQSSASSAQVRGMLAAAGCVGAGVAGECVRGL